MGGRSSKCVFISTRFTAKVGLHLAAIESVNRETQHVSDYVLDGTFGDEHREP